MACEYAEVSGMGLVLCVYLFIYVVFLATKVCNHALKKPLQIWNCQLSFLLRSIDKKGRMSWPAPFINENTTGHYVYSHELRKKQ